MLIIIGLGNPGAQFNHTPHNAGFEALDFFAQQNSFPEFTESKKHQALVSEKDGVMLVKPLTFMNESGKTAASLMKNQQVSLIVIHDDIDVQLGKIKVSTDSGSGGHKGVSSIIQTLGTQQFTRVKIGVDPTAASAKSSGEPRHKAEDVVLKKFAPEQYEILQGVFPQVAQTLQTIMNESKR